MSDVPAVKERVQNYLTTLGPVEIDERGMFGFLSGSTHVIVQVVAHPDEKAALVVVSCSLLFEVPLTPELYKHVAIHADDWWFGHLFVVTNEETGLGTVVARHVLMGDYLDKDELIYAVTGVAGSADDPDDRLREPFGGKRYEDT